MMKTPTNIDWTVFATYLLMVCMIARPTDFKNIYEPEMKTVRR